MDPVCHRCGTALTSPEVFCPHCGAPQLRFEATEEQTRYQSEPVNGALRIGQFVAWRPAVQTALLVAIPVGLLSALLDFGIVWVLAGGFCAVALYQRKASMAVPRRAGWRIGMLMGVLAAFLSSVTDGVSVLIERFGLHRGVAIDEKLATVTQQMTAQMTEQMARQSPEAVQQLSWFVHFWQSPDGRAALVLFMSAFTALMMIIFSTLGGALGGRVLAARRRLSTNS